MWWDAEEGAARVSNTGGSWIAAWGLKVLVDLKYLCRTKSLYCHHHNALGGTA